MNRLISILFIALPLILIGIVIGTAAPDIKRYIEMRNM
jgi:hypothetical protein